MLRSSRAALAATIGIMGLVSVSGAQAQVYYRGAPPLTSYGFPFYPFSDQSPYAQEYGERPSYQIIPNGYGGPVVRAVPRCNYPNGWNITDFDRDLNGIPAGIDHQCPVPEPTRYRPRY